MVQALIHLLQIRQMRTAPDTPTLGVYILPGPASIVHQARSDTCSDKRESKRKIRAPRKGAPQQGGPDGDAIGYGVGTTFHGITRTQGVRLVVDQIPAEVNLRSGTAKSGHSDDGAPRAGFVHAEGHRPDAHQASSGKGSLSPTTRSGRKRYRQGTLHPGVEPAREASELSK
jgi:hypothetical protein